MSILPHLPALHVKATPLAHPEIIVVIQPLLASFCSTDLLLNRG